MWYFSPNLFWWYHTFQPWENVLTFFCIVMFKICQFLRALIHNVTTAFIRSTHFKNFFFFARILYSIQLQCGEWRRQFFSRFIASFTRTDGSHYVPKLQKKSYFEEKSCFVGRINLPLTDQPSLNLFWIKLFFSCLFIINQNIKKLYLLLF